MITTMTNNYRAVVVVIAMVAALVLAGGVAQAATISCQADLDCVGTKKADTLNGSAGNDNIFGRGRGDTLNGLGGYDDLYGQGGTDKLFGGPDGDNLIGGSGNDALNGGGGYDHYYFSNGWGKDSIIDSGSSANGLDLRLPSSNGYVTEDVTVRLTPGPGPEVKNNGTTNTISWEEPGLIENVDGGAGDDEIAGDAVANDIWGNSGSDTIHGEGGTTTSLWMTVPVAT